MSDFHVLTYLKVGKHVEISVWNTWYLTRGIYVPGTMRYNEY